jgi:hypothetical protein
MREREREAFQHTYADVGIRQRHYFFTIVFLFLNKDPLETICQQEMRAIKLRGRCDPPRLLLPLEL